MNKKAMAIAVAGVLAAPSAAVLAQTSTVQIGGSITTFYYSHSPKNSSSGQRTDILETSEPEMFVRGEEKLGGGLSAWFQCTSSLDAMVTGAVDAGGFCGRNSGIGLKGSFGNLFQGNWDTPDKLVYNNARQWFGGTNSFTGGSARLLLGGSASGQGNSVAGSNTPSSFFRRQASSWNYHSPSWNGFTVNGAFSAANEQTGIPEASPLTPRMWSLGANYSSGPLYLGLGYERHNDYNPSNQAAALYTGGTDDNWTLVAGYRWGGFSVRGAYVRSEYDTTNTTQLKVRGFALFGDWNIQGPHTLRAQYADVSDMKGNSAVSVSVYRPPMVGGVGVTDTGAKLWSIFYSYAFSKRTEGSIGYTKLKNDRNAGFTLGKVNASTGNNQTSAGIVFKHRF